MPKSFLFTHRRYNASPIPNEEPSLTLDKNDSPFGKTQQHSREPAVPGYAVQPLSPGQGSEAELKSPGRPQSARISPVNNSTSVSSVSKGSIPEEMYNLFQLAEVSLAASGSSEFRLALDRWRHQQELARVINGKKLPPSAVEPVLDKPLDLSRSDSSTNSSAATEVRIILTPSPSPTPSESHLTMNLGLRKAASNLQHSPSERSDESDGDDSCWSPDADTASCQSAEVKASGSDNNSHSGDGHECPDCGKRYSTSSNLARHRQTHRSPADQKARRCPHCDKVYVSVPAFSMHVRTHSQGCKCPYCGKSFSRPWLLQGHIRTHTGEKPFCCQICDKAFADKSNLRAHIQTHSNLKPFTCQRCGKAFALKSYLYKHEESSCMKMVKTKDE